MLGPAQSRVVRVSIVIMSIAMGILALPWTLEGGYWLPRVLLLLVVVPPAVVLTSPALVSMARTRDGLRSVSIYLGAVALVVTLISTLRSGALSTSLLGVDARGVGAVTVAALFLLVPVVVAVFRDTPTIDQLLLAIGIGVALSSSAALVEVFLPSLLPPLLAAGGSVGGTLGNSNLVAAVAAIGVPHGLALSLTPRRRVLGVVLTGVNLAALVVAESLLGWVGAIGGSLVLLTLVALRSHLRRPLEIAVAAAPALAPLVGLALVYVGALRGDISGEVRVTYLNLAGRIWVSEPLLGVGPGRYMGHHREFRSPQDVLPGVASGEHVADSSHAWLGDLLATGGLVLVALFMVLLVVAGLGLRQRWTAASDDDRPAQMQAATLVAMLVAHGLPSSISIPTVATVVFGALLVGASIGVVDTGSPRPSRHRKGARRAPRPSAVVTTASAAILFTGLSVVGYSYLVSARDINQVQAALEVGEVGAAQMLAERAVTRTPSWKTAWLWRARVDDVRGDLAAGRTALESALDLDPRDWGALLGIAQLAAAVGDDAEAAAWFVRGHELDPYGQVFNLAMARWALDAGRPDLAETSISSLEQVFPPGTNRRVDELRADLTEMASTGS